MPVELSIGVRERLPESAEVAAYYVVAEALTNTAKHAQASTVDVASMPTTPISISRLRMTESGELLSVKDLDSPASLTASRRSAARWTSPAVSDVGRLCASPSLSNPCDRRPHPEGESGLRAGH